ncbi:MAG: copper resistance protein NlpE N-terminal domain-containing protein [Lysobacter sp.]
MNHKLLALACAGLATVAIAGCKPQAPVEPAAPVAPVVPVVPATTAEPAPVVATSISPALDQKGFAGTFASGGSTITLKADGTFKLKQDNAAFDGSWTAEADGAQIRLDPDSKAEPDRLYAVVGKDEIRPLDSAGQPIEGGTGLRRESSEY